MDSVDKLVNSFDTRTRPLAEKLRTIVKAAVPQAKESVKWGNVHYSLNGKNFVMLSAYPDHVNLGMFLGAKLNSRLLEGSGKGLRHIKVRNEGDIKKEEFSNLLREAAKMY